MLIKIFASDTISVNVWRHQLQEQQTLDSLLKTEFLFPSALLNRMWLPPIQCPATELKRAERTADNLLTQD